MDPGGTPGLFQGPILYHFARRFAEQVDLARRFAEQVPFPITAASQMHVDRRESSIFFTDSLYGDAILPPFKFAPGSARPDQAVVYKRRNNHRNWFWPTRSPFDYDSEARQQDKIRKVRRLRCRM